MVCTVYAHSQESSSNERRYHERGFDDRGILWPVEETSTLSDFFVSPPRQTTEYVIDYEEMPYESEFDVEYTVDWFAMNRDIYWILQKRLNSLEYFDVPSLQPGAKLYINGDDRKVTISAKEYLLKNVNFFNISPLKTSDFRNLHICRVGTFQSEDDDFIKVNLCVKASDEEYTSSYVPPSPFVITTESKKFGNCEIRFEVEHKVASITLYVVLSILAVVFVIGFIIKGTQKGYRKFVSLRTRPATADYQHI